MIDVALAESSLSVTVVLNVLKASANKIRCYVYL